MPGGRPSARARREPHAPGPGLRSRLPGRPRLAGALRPRRLQRLPAPRPQPRRRLPARARASSCRPPTPSTSSSSSRRPTAHLYWLDLDRLLDGTLDPLDTQRAQALARFLADAHATKRDEPTLYARRIRELVGHGECVMGILDSYPHPSPVLPPAACEALEVGDGALALAAARSRPPSVAHARRFSSLEHPVPRRDRLQRPRPQPRRVGRAGRRRGRARHQLPVLRHAQGGPRMASGAWPSRSAACSTTSWTPTSRPAATTSCSRRCRRSSPSARWSWRIPRWYPDLPGTVRSDLAHLARLADAADPLRPGRRVVAVRSGPMSWAIWVTGLPGCGKIDRRARGGGPAARRRDAGRAPRARRMRAVVTPHPTYSETEREIVYRSLVFAAVALTEAGVPVIVDATAHRRAWRDLARASIERFAEVQLDCPLGVAEPARARARAGAAPRAIYAGADDAGRHRAGSQRALRARSDRRSSPSTPSPRTPRRPATRIAALGLTLGPAERRPAGGRRSGALAHRAARQRQDDAGLASWPSGWRSDGGGAPILEWAALRALALTAPWVARARRGDRAPRARLHGQAARRRRPRGRGRRDGATPGLARAGPGDRRRLRRGPARCAAPRCVSIASGRCAGVQHGG